MVAAVAALGCVPGPHLGCCLRFDSVCRLSVAEVLPLAQGILNGLFTAFQQPDSTENEYLMRAVMRLISFLGPQIAPVAPLCLKVSVCKNVFAGGKDQAVDGTEVGGRQALRGGIGHHVVP